MTLVLHSTAFIEGAEIPRGHTCRGDDCSPPLAWTGAPAGTRSFALLVEDPDAPDPAAPKLTWVHWALYDIPADCTRLAAGADDNDLPPGTRRGITNRGDTRYHGPCPPVGTHRYFHRLFALDTTLGDLGHPAAGRLRSAMRGHVLEEASLMGTFPA